MYFGGQSVSIKASYILQLTTGTKFFLSFFFKIKTKFKLLTTTEK